MVVETYSHLRIFVTTWEDERTWIDVPIRVLYCEPHTLTFPTDLHLTDMECM